MKPILLLAFVLLSLSAAAQWTLIYENDRQGQPVNGDKDTLISAVRSGAEVRIGWRETPGWKKDEFIEHFATPTTVFIASNGEVFAELPAVAEVHVGRRNTIITRNDGRRIPLVSTNGCLELNAVDEASLIRRHSDKSGVKWFVRK